MKYTKAADGYEIQVGDCIRANTRLSKWTIKVHRITPKFAFIRYNDVAEGKFPRVYRSFDFSSLPRQQWQTTTYEVFRAEEVSVEPQASTESK